MKKIIILLLILIAVWKFSQPGEVSTGPGVMAEDIPLQVDLPPGVIAEVDDYQINQLAEFRIKAKVLGREDYTLDREADLSPTDLALGWGRMSDETVLAEVDISQSGRFYFWRVESFPIPRQEIVSSSANMHLIPASGTVKSEIDSVRRGDIVEIKGYLVEARSQADGWRWRSSLTRNDSGAGACELIWVEQLNIVTP
ncbi:hypothetical protein [Neptuniibacter halophilus]|uniref:hypothetical protein n=1 Tax=Neptuniibacter halophilus TaxID=651666 RepID=UPI002573137E|nr:hypothetical protein [Neptuniibacter halophilus]